MTLGKFIARYLDENDLSISEFGRKCGISKAYVSMLIKGINPANGEPLAPSIKIMDKLARGMNVSVDELFRNVDSLVMVNDNESSDSDDQTRLPGFFKQYYFDKEYADIAHESMVRPEVKEWNKLAKNATDKEVRLSAIFLKTLIEDRQNGGDAKTL